MDFPCTQCGECCRHVDKVLDPNSFTYKSSPTVIKDLIDRFPYQINKDGSCSMLDSNGKCKVYDSRPIICNVRLGGLLLHQNQLDWFKNRADGCNKLISDAGLDPKYLVFIDEQIPEKTSQTYEEGRSGPRKKRRRKNS